MSRVARDAAELVFQRALARIGAGDLRAANAELARATQLHPEDPRLWIARGVNLLKLRHYEEAARCLRTGVELGPKYGEADARLSLANALWEAGRRREAIQEWTHVSGLAPTYPGFEDPIREARRRLEHL